jgi:hypothetical protein
VKKLLILLFFLPLLSFAQNIKGEVISEKTNLPIDDVNIAAFNFNTFTLTNENGEFTLRLPSNFKEKNRKFIRVDNYCQFRIKIKIKTRI